MLPGRRAVRPQRFLLSSFSRRRCGKPMAPHLILTLLVSFSLIGGGNSSVMVTLNETFLVEPRTTLRLPCEFVMLNFSMFENPIIWNKRQPITEEEVQMNIMGNILEPFLSTHRFQATLENEDPRYRMTLQMTDFSAEDVGNYTCEVRGRRSVVLGRVHHSAFLKAPANDLILEMGGNSSGKSSVIAEFLRDHPTDERSLVFLENRFQPVTCSCRSYSPHAKVRVHLANAGDVSGSFDDIRLTSFTGVKGLHVVQYIVIRTSFNLTFTSLDDDRPITCSVTVPGLAPNKTERLISVIYKPYFKCPESTAYIGETNVFLKCQVKARPPVTSLYWVLSDNDTSANSNSNSNNNNNNNNNNNDDNDNNNAPDTEDYWSTVTDLNDGSMETRFFIRHVHNKSFKSYKVISENQLGISSALVRLRQVNKPLPYESRLQSDNPTWHPKVNPSLEYVVIRSAPNQPSSSSSSSSSSTSSSTTAAIQAIHVVVLLSSASPLNTVLFQLLNSFSTVPCCYWPLRLLFKCGRP